MWVEFGSGEPHRLIAMGMDQPDYVVSTISDSPLESKRFSDVKIGEGLAVHAMDNSNTATDEHVDRVVAMGWPPRYSHTPGEVIDTRDVDALGKIVKLVARQW